MVLLFHKSVPTHKTSSKIKHHESPESLATSFHSFETDILNSLYQLSLCSKNESESYSFSWIQTCLRVLQSVDVSFKKFTEEIAYPVTEWNSFIVEEYLEGNLGLLDHFNCISSSLNHKSQACIELLHALSQFDASPPVISKNLKEILPWCSKKGVREVQEQQGNEMNCSGKELIVYKALLVKKRVQNWLCRIIDSGISGGDLTPDCSGVYNISVASFQSGICEAMKRKGVLKEIAEINRGVVQLLASKKEGRQSKDLNELRGRVEVLRKLLDGVKEDINKMFSEAMERRNEMLDGIRSRK